MEKLFKAIRSGNFELVKKLVEKTKLIDKTKLSDFVFTEAVKMSEFYNHKEMHSYLKRKHLKSKLMSLDKGDD